MWLGEKTADGFMVVVPIGGYELQGIGNRKFDVAVPITEIQSQGRGPVQYVISSE